MTTLTRSRLVTPELVTAATRALAVRARHIGPDPQPCTCGAPRHVHAGRTRAGACERTGCARYRRDPADALAAAAAASARATLLRDLDTADRARARFSLPRLQPGPAEGWRVYVSDIYGCRRKIQYKARPPADLVRDPTNRNQAIIGTALHNAGLAAARALYPWRIIEGRLAIPGLDRSGRVDDYDPILGRVRDVKTGNDGKFRMVEQDGPPASDRAQTMIYGRALEDAGWPVLTVLLEYVHRESGRTLRFEYDYDRDQANRALAWFGGVLAALDAGVDLPRDRSGPTNDPLCALCEFRSHCWDIPRAEAAGRSPESWIFLGPDPDCASIAAIGEEVIAAGAAAKAAETEKKRLMTLLGGVPPGEYGPIEIVPKGRNNTNWDLYRQNLETWWYAPAAAKPPLAEIPLPTSRSTWVEVRRVPAARTNRRQRDQRGAA